MVAVAAAEAGVGLMDDESGAAAGGAGAGGGVTRSSNSSSSASAGGASAGGALVASLHAQVVEEVVSLGNDPLALEVELRKTVEEEQQLKEQIRAALAAGSFALTNEGGGAEPEGGGDASEDHRAQLQRSLAELGAAVPTLSSVFAGAAKLDARISETRGMADVVSRRVREIDLARSRSLLALVRVRRAMELRACLKGATESLVNFDLEAASEFVHKYRASAEQQADGQGREQQAGGGGAGADEEEHDALDEQAVEELAQCEKSLSRAVLSELESAIAEHDDERVMRACRVFGKLGQAQEGVARLLAYRCELLRANVTHEAELTEAQFDSGGVDLYEYDGQQQQQQAEQGADNKKTFLSLLVFLINAGADAIQRTASLVRKHVGDSGELRAQVIGTIHEECDRLLVRILRLMMGKMRVEERVRVLVREPSNLAGAVALGSAALETRAEVDPTFPLFEIDSLLDDLALSLKHTETYTSFILSRARGAEGLAAQVVGGSEYVNVAQEVAGFYAVLEEAYLRSAVDTAVQQEVLQSHISQSSLGKPDDDEEQQEQLEVQHQLQQANGSDSHPLASKEVAVSSLAEDAFYVVDKCLDRAKATRHADSACAVINHVIQALEDKVAGLLSKRVAAIKEDPFSLSAQGAEHLDKLRQAAFSQAQALGAASSPSSSSAAAAAAARRLGDKDAKGSSAAGDAAGALAAASSEFGSLVPVEDPLENADSTLNSLLLCSANTDQLRVALEAFAAQDAWPPKQRSKLTNCIDGLLETREVFRRARDTGVDRLTQLLKPRLQQQLDATLGAPATSYDLDERAYAALSAGNDPHVRALLHLTAAGLDHVSRRLSADNCVKVAAAVAAFEAKRLEAAALRKRFSQFGALLLDRQVRDIKAFFAPKAGPRTTNECFRRLQQIVALLSLDQVEDLHDVYSGDSPNGIATKEVKRVLALRADFKTDDIKRLKV